MATRQGIGTMAMKLLGWSVYAAVFAVLFVFKWVAILIIALFSAALSLTR